MLPAIKSRRFLLKLLFGSVGFSLLAMGKLRQAFAEGGLTGRNAESGPVGRKDVKQVPRTAAEAVQSADPDVIVGFILRYRNAVSQWNAADKIRMLQAMDGSVRQAYARSTLSAPSVRYEEAFLIVLKDMERDHVALERAIATLGGKSALKAKSAGIHNEELKAFALKATAR